MATERRRRKAPTVEEEELPGRLRAERERRNISLRELARRLDVTPSAISQIETGRARPSVSTLYAIVSELGMSLDELFARDGVRRGDTPVSDAQAAPAVVSGRANPVGPRLPRSARKSLDLETGVRWERLTAAHDEDVDFLYVTYDVGGASSAPGQMVRHSGREYGLVLSGILNVTVGFDTYEVATGDSICFESTVPHRLANDGDVPVTGVWFVVGRRSSDRRSHALADDNGAGRSS